MNMRFTYKSPRIFYWIKYELAGKYGLLGPENSEAEANDRAIADLQGIKYEIIPLNTKNKSAASSKLRAMILHQTRDINQAMQRIRRKVPSDNKPQNQSTTEYVHFV